MSAVVTRPLGLLVFVLLGCSQDSSFVSEMGFLDGAELLLQHSDVSAQGKMPEPVMRKQARPVIYSIYS